MAKASKGSGAKDPKAKAKAGKRSGQYVEPPAASESNKAARDAGFQQFIAKEQLTALVPKIVFNKKTMQIEEKMVSTPVDFLWDANRKQFVFSPNQSGGNQ